MRTLLGLLVLAFSISCWAQSNPPTPSGTVSTQPVNADSKQSQQNRANESRGTESAPIFVKSIPGPKTTEDAEYEKWERHEKPALDRRLTVGTELLAVFTFLLFVFTACLWYVTYRLSNDAKEASIQQSKDTESALKISRQAADATAALVKSTNANAQLELRAYLSPNWIAWRGFIDGVPLAAQYEMVCYGQTPARSVRVFGAIEIAPFPLQKHLLRKPTEVVLQAATVFPKETRGLVGWVTAERPFTSDEIATVFSQGSGKGVYMHGQITYKDVFDEHRETFFRFMIDPSSIVRNAQGKIITFVWAVVEGGNDFN